MINMVKSMKHFEFEKEEKYKLFRSVKEILHPSISKKNISDYKIVVNEDLAPIRIFYPKKVSSIQDVMIFIHGECKITNCKGKYSDISSRFSEEYNRLVISIDYNDEVEVPEIISEVYDCFSFIYHELLNCGIKVKMNEQKEKDIKIDILRGKLRAAENEIDRLRGKCSKENN